MAVPLTLQRQDAAVASAVGTRSTSGVVSGSDSVAWSRGSSDDNPESFVFRGRLAPVVGCRVIEDPPQKASSSKAVKRSAAPRSQPRPLQPRMKNPSIASHAAAVAASKASSFSFLRGRQSFVGGTGNVTKICTYEGTIEDYLQMRSTDASSCSEGCSSAVSERGSSTDKVTPRHSSGGLSSGESNECISSRHSSAGTEKDQLDGATSRKCSQDVDSRSDSSRIKSGCSELSLSSESPNQQDIQGDQQSGGEQELSVHQQPQGSSAVGRGRLIELKMENGCVVWPTDRPVIPLPYWQLTSYAHEPLTPQQWAQLPIVGAPSPYAQLLDPASSVVGTQADLEIRQARAAGSRGSRRGLSTPPAPSQHLSGTLPRIKLPVGAEAPPLSICISPTPANQANNCFAPAAPTPGRPAVQRSSSVAGRSMASRLGGPPGESGSIFTAFHNQLFVSHLPSNGEGEVLRTEDKGTSFVVRLRNGRVKKFPRSDCRVIKAVCTPTKTPSERALTAASHQHAMTMMLNQQTGLASALTLGGGGAVEGLRGSMTLTQRGTTSLTASLTAPTVRASLPQGLQGKHDRKPGSLFDLLKFRKDNIPPLLHTKSNMGPKPKVPIHSTMRGAEQVPAIEEVLQLAQGNGAAPNTVQLACAVSEPKIRAVEDQTSVETIRLKKYTIEEGHEEGNFVPFFPPECEGLQAEASRQEQTQHPDGLSQDPRQLLLDRHRALEEIERRQQEKEEEEVIYAQDAPDATRAPGIAPPTIIKETLVVVPPKDETDDVSRLIQAPGIVLPCIHEPPKMEITCPLPGRANATMSLACQRSPSNSNSVEPPDESGIAWYSGLQQQFRDQLLKQYAETGSLQAATAAVTGAGFPLPESVVPFPFSGLAGPQVNRKQARVLRDEAEKIELQPIA